LYNAKNATINKSGLFNTIIIKDSPAVNQKKEYFPYTKNARISLQIPAN